MTIAEIFLSVFIASSSFDSYVEILDWGTSYLNVDERVITGLLVEDLHNIAAAAPRLIG